MKSLKEADNNKDKNDFFNYCANDPKLKELFNDEEMNILYKELSNTSSKFKNLPRRSLRGSSNSNNTSTNNEASYSHNNLTIKASPNKNLLEVSPFHSIGRDSSHKDKSVKISKVDLKGDIQSAISGRNQFILRLLKYATSKFESYKEKMLAKAMAWLENEMSNILMNLSDNQIGKLYKQVKGNQTKGDDKENSMIGNFIKEFSNLALITDIIENQKKPATLRSRTHSTSSEKEEFEDLEKKLSKDNSNSVVRTKYSLNERPSQKSLTDFTSDIPPISSKRKTSENLKNKRGNKRLKSATTKQPSLVGKFKKNSTENILQQDSNDNSINDKFLSDDSFVDALDQNLSALSIRVSSPDIEIINYNENHLVQIETSNFNIFLLEKDVGEKNILPAISIYIFQQYNYYSKIDSDKFENFICEIVKGYKRSNPYHHVIKYLYYLNRIYMRQM